MDDQNPDHLQSLQAFITTAYQNGHNPSEITQQLKQAGWPDDQIEQAFKLAQAQLTPTSGASTPRRGRIKTGWLLFKESWRILRSDKTLVRFVIISGLWSLLLLIIYGLIMALGHKTFFGTRTTADDTAGNGYLKPWGYVPTFIYYVLAFFVVNLYAAGLTLSVFDLFQGQKQPYDHYMQQARAKAGKLFVFSLIEATVGVILRFISERSRILGRIVAAVIGVVWSVARLFVVPILATSNEGVIPAIKDSSKLLVSTWGENIIGRVSMGGTLMLIFWLVMIPLTIVLVLAGAAIAHGWGVVAALFIVFIAFVIYAVVASAVSQVLNVALFFYAKNKQVPQAFDAGLLNAAFIYRKRGKLARLTNL